MKAVYDGRNARVDRLRGLAIIVVMLGHSNGFMAWYEPLSNLLALRTNAFYGVTIFFTISGFLITQKLATSSDAGGRFFSTFYLHRFARLIPCILLVFPLATILSALSVREFAFTGYGIDQFAGCLLALRYNVCFMKPGLPGGRNALWSLSVEEVFYLFYPFIVYSCRKSVVTLSAALIFFAVFGPLYRIWIASSPYSYFGNFDQMALGCLAALHGHRFRRFASNLRWFGLASILVVFFSTEIISDLGFAPSLVSAGAMLYLMGCGAEDPSESPLPLRVLQQAGRLSYELYLFHLPFLAVLIRPMNEWLSADPRLLNYAAIVEMPVYFGGMLVVAALIARNYSEPANRWIRNLAQSKTFAFHSRLPASH